MFPPAQAAVDGFAQAPRHKGERPRRGTVPWASRPAGVRITAGFLPGPAARPAIQRRAEKEAGQAELFFL